MRIIILLMLLLSNAVLSSDKLTSDGKSGIWEREFVHPLSGKKGKVVIDTNSEKKYAVVTLGSEERVYDNKTGFVLIEKYGTLQNTWVEFSEDEKYQDYIYMVTSGDGTMNMKNDDGTCNFLFIESGPVVEGASRNRTSASGGCDWRILHKYKDQIPSDRF